MDIPTFSFTFFFLALANSLSVAFVLTSTVVRLQWNLIEHSVVLGVVMSDHKVCFFFFAQVSLSILCLLYRDYLLRVLCVHIFKASLCVLSKGYIYFTWLKRTASQLSIQTRNKRLMWQVCPFKETQIVFFCTKSVHKDTLRCPSTDTYVVLVL